MDIMHPKAAIGTNAWGGRIYGGLIRGDYVEDEVIGQMIEESVKLDIPLFDLARDYGFGKAQKMMGRLGNKDTLISAKYTPFTHYRKGCVRKSLEKDLQDFGRSFVDIYWLHLPTDLKDHLEEIAELYKEGKIRYVGVSNFDLEECKRSKEILEAHGIPLYGVQNHYSIICREWETNGLLKWCRENNILFWGWAVLEEGLLVDPSSMRRSVMKSIYNGRVKKLSGLYDVMGQIATRRKVKIPMIAIAYCAAKGVVPVVGCRKPSRVRELSESVSLELTPEEIERLESAADASNVKIMGADIFRPFVLKERR